MTKEKDYINNREYVEKLLKEYPRKENVLKKLNLDIKEIKLGFDGGLGAVDYSKDRIQSNNVSSSVESNVIRIEDTIERIEKEKSIKSIHFDKIEIALEALTEMQRKVIEYRHFKSFTWGTVEKYIGYTDRQCMNINNDIIKMLISFYNIKKY